MPASADRPYFAYGSNLDAQDWQRFCAEHGFDDAHDGLNPLGPAWLGDWELSFTYRSLRRDAGALTINPALGRCVSGALFAVSQAGWRALDAKEGAGQRYDRMETIVVDASGREILALTYRTRPELRLETPIPPSRGYLEAVCRGRRAVGHDTAAAERAGRGEPSGDPGAVFVYGTLQPGECNFPALAPVIEASQAQPALLLGGGRLVDLGSYPGLVDLGREDAHPVRDTLLPLTDAPGAVRAMDPIEVFQGYGVADNLYRRVLVRVRTEDGAERLAWSYLYLQDISAARPISTGMWTC
ncbi:MAG: gamma-glutamylcyclotransferase [Rhodospirillaceae bacterium]